MLIVKEKGKKANRVNDVAADVAQQERNNNKYYASTFGILLHLRQLLLVI